MASAGVDGDTRGRRVPGAREPRAGGAPGGIPARHHQQQGGAQGRLHCQGRGEPATWALWCYALSIFIYYPLCDFLLHSLYGCQRAVISTVSWQCHPHM